MTLKTFDKQSNARRIAVELYRRCNYRLNWKWWSPAVWRWREPVVVQPRAGVGGASAEHCAVSQSLAPITRRLRVDWRRLAELLRCDGLCDWEEPASIRGIVCDISGISVVAVWRFGIGLYIEHRYAVVTNTIRLRFDGRLTGVWLLIKGH